MWRIILSIVVAVFGLLWAANMWNQGTLPAATIQATQMQRNVRAKKTHVTATDPLDDVAIEAPEIVQLMQYPEIFRARGDYRTVLDMASIYQRGVYPRLVPDDDMAARLLRSMAARCPDRRLATQAKVLYMEGLVDAVPDKDRKGQRLPRGPGHHMLRVMEERVRERRNPVHQTDPPPAVMMAVLPTPPLVGAPLDFDHEIALAMHMERNWADVPLRRMQHEVQPSINRYSQSSHDHMVVQTVARVFEELPSAPSATLDVLAIRRILNDNREMDDPTKSDAIRVLDMMMRSPREMQALAKVWQHIQQESDPTIRSNREETLGKVLASGVERGSVVCQTGRLSRLASLMQGTGGDVETIRDMDSLSREIMFVASGVRNKVLADVEPELNKSYENGTNEYLAREMERIFRDQVRKDYVDELGLSEEILEPIISSAVDAF